jgi:hypothetical protein
MRKEHDELYTLVKAMKPKQGRPAKRPVAAIISSGSGGGVGLGGRAEPANEEDESSDSFDEDEDSVSEEEEAGEGVGSLDAKNTEESAGEIHCGSDADIKSSDIDNEAVVNAADENAPAEEVPNMNSKAPMILQADFRMFWTVTILSPTSSVNPATLGPITKRFWEVRHRLRRMVRREVRSSMTT